MVWKIRSHRSYQHEGDPIYYDDYLQVYHEGLDCFMNFAENNKPIYLDSLVEGNKQEQDALKNSCSGSL